MTTLGVYENFADITSSNVTSASILNNLYDADANNKVIVALQEELAADGDAVVSQVDGAIDETLGRVTNPAKATAAELGKNGLYAITLMQQFAEQVKTFDQVCVDCENRYQTRRTQINHDPDYRFGGRTEAYQSADSYIRTTYYNPAKTTIDQQIQAMGTALENGPNPDVARELIRNGFMPISAASMFGITLTAEDRQLYYKNWFAKMTPEEQVQFIKDELAKPRIGTPGGPILDPDMVAGLSPEAQAIFADEVAEDIQNKDITTETVTYLSLFKDLEPFSHELFTTVTPNELGDAIKDINDEAFPDNASSSDEETRNFYSSFLHNLGQSFATYTKGTGEYAPPDDLAETWFEAITDDDNEENAAALTLLIRKGGEHTSFGDDFIRDLTGKVYDWERSHDGDAVWGPRDQGIWDPDKTDTKITYGPHGTTTTTYDGVRGTDGLANLMAGLANNPDAAKDFFHGDYDGYGDDEPDSLDERMEYLIGGEDGRTFDRADKSDDGDGLGLALEAATVGEDTRTAEGTEIANKMLEQIVEYGGKGDGLFTDEWHIGPEMTDSLGAILSGYTGDLHDELSGAGADDGPLNLNIPGEPSDFLQQVLGELGRPEDKTGLETLTAAMMLQGKAELNDQIAALDGPHTLENLNGAGLEGIQGENGKVMGLLLQYGLDMASDDDKTDEARAELLAKGIDIASGFLPGASSVLGETASHLAKSTYDTLQGQGIDLLKEATKSAPDTDEYLDNNAMTLDQRIMYFGMDSIIENGYLGPQETKFGDYSGVPQDMLVGDPPHIDPRLYDEDGHNIDTSEMTSEEREQAEAAQAAWREFNESPEYGVVRSLTQQSEFMKYFTDPTL